MRKVLLTILFICTVALNSNAQCALDSFTDDIDKIENFIDTNGTDAWFALFKSGADDKIRQTTEHLEFLTDYLKTSSKSVDDVAEEIKKAGGFDTWKINNAGGSFASLGNKVSSLAPDALKKIEKLLKENQTIIRFNYGGKVSQTAEQFLKTVGDDFYDITFRNGAYAKFDKQTGRMLYVEGDLHAFVRYTEGNNVSGVKALLTDRVTKMRNILGLNGVQTIQLHSKMGSLVVKSDPSKTLTFIGKTDETQLLKDLFGDFKHIQVGEIKGGINLLNRSDVNWIGNRWWKDYNKGWMLRAIKRGDDIYIASPINKKVLYNKTKDLQEYGSYYSRELYEVVKAGIKPKNISQAKWNALIPDIKKAALTNIPY